MFTDTWSDISINGINRPDVTLEFEVKDDTEFYNFGNNESLPIEYLVNLSGIMRDEKIKRGESRKISFGIRKGGKAQKKRNKHDSKERNYRGQGR